MLIENKIRRFLSQIEPDFFGGCWLWSGAIHRCGYGTFSHNGGSLAHRASYQLFKGETKGLHVLHKCDVKCCVNPNHLFLGTNADNVADKVAKGRARGGGRKGSLHHASKLGEIEISAIKAACLAGETQQSQADRFGVSQSTINEIVKGKAWKHVK